MPALSTQKVQTMARVYKPNTRLDRLNFSPENNPLAEHSEVKSKNRLVRAGRLEHFTNVQSGEITHTSLLHEIVPVDTEHFVKIFASGVIAMYELTRTAQRVFALVLKKYQESEMKGGFSDTVELFWFNAGLDGKAAGMSEETFNRGLRELIDKQFLYPRITHSYWVNANLFFKGDRVMFIKEYRKITKAKAAAKTNTAAQLHKRDPNTVDFVNKVTDAELVEQNK